MARMSIEVKTKMRWWAKLIRYPLSKTLLFLTGVGLMPPRFAYERFESFLEKAYLYKIGGGEWKPLAIE